MKKILIAVDASHLNRSSLSFGSYLARLTRSIITGVFLENMVSHEQPMVQIMRRDGHQEWKANGPTAVPPLIEARIAQSINQFKAFFSNHGIICSIHEDKDTPLIEIVEETRYADLLITDAEISFDKHPKEVQTSFVKEVLARAECPVIIAPQNFEGIDEIIFAYYGSRSCMHAIKQFSYLFPQLEDKRMTIVQVNEPDHAATVDRSKFNEWLQNHYSNVHFKELNCQTETQLLSYLVGKKKAFIVMGAYGRSIISTFYKRSPAGIITQINTQPIFIAQK